MCNRLLSSLLLLIQTLRLLNVCLTVGKLLLVQSHWHSSPHTTYIFENQKSDFTSQKQVTGWAKNELTDYLFLYVKAEGDDKNVSHHMSCINI